MMWFIKNNKSKNKKNLCFGWKGEICDKIQQKKQWLFDEMMHLHEAIMWDYAIKYGISKDQDEELTSTTILYDFDEITQDSSDNITYFILK